jgi:chromosome segregation ATPase
MITRKLTKMSVHPGENMGWKETQEKMEAQLKELGTRLEAWKNQAAKAGGEAQAEMNKKLEQLRPKLEAAQQKLKDLKAAGGEAAEKVKEGSEKAMAELKKTWEAVKSKFE